MKPNGLKAKTIIGIDPGKSNGAIAAYTFRPETFAMPSDILELTAILQSFPQPFVFIEKVSKWRGDSFVPGKQFGIDKLLANYEMILNAVKVSGIPYLEVHPRTWQKDYGKSKFPNKKDHFVAKAKELYPEMKVTKRNADALLIMHCGRVWTIWGYDWIYVKSSKFTKEKATWLWEK